MKSNTFTEEQIVQMLREVETLGRGAMLTA